MSAIKSPLEKKTLSLKRDRRNRYGENSKSSRKNIRRGKQRSQMEGRRVVNATLSVIKGTLDEDVIDGVESRARVQIIQGQRQAFKKRRDTPLGEVLVVGKQRVEAWVAWREASKSKVQER